MTDDADWVADVRRWVAAEQQIKAPAAAGPAPAERKLEHVVGDRQVETPSLDAPTIHAR